MPVPRDPHAPRPHQRRASQPASRGAGEARPRSGSAQRRPSSGTHRPGSRPSRRPGSRSYRARRRFPVANSGRRLRILIGLVTLSLLLLIGRAFQLQALESQSYAVAAAKQMTRTQELQPARGEILDRNGRVLATSEPAVKVIADPSIIATNGVDPRLTLSASQQAAAQAAPGAIAAVLAKYLGGAPGDYLKYLTAKQPNSSKYSMYQVVKTKVPAWTYVQIANDLAKGGEVDGHKVSSWYGIHKEDDPIRVYPAGAVASNVLGFMRGDGTAGGGLEYALNDSLSGIPGRESYEVAAYGRIPLGNSTLTPAVNGTSYTLTIDSEMQLLAQNAISAQVKKTAAKSGEAIVMNVKTGEVLAMATTPGFDPNNLQKADAADLGNGAVTSPYEPGSVEKVLTMASLADQGLVTADTHVVVPPRIASGGGYIHDVYSHGTVNMTARGVIANSSNIGMTELARTMSKQSFIDHLQAFGLGRPTGIGLPGESGGTLPSADMPDYTRDQIAFGQGVSVTAIQMASAVAAIANGGVYNPPTILKAAVDGSGNPVALPAPEPRRVVSQQAASQVLDMMESVITQIGGGTREIPNYRMAGKSGTAEIASDGAKNGYTASFVGVAPVENPQILVYVVINKPIHGTEGGVIAVPVVKQLMQLALPRYGVAPSTTPPRKEPLTFK